MSEGFPTPPAMEQSTQSECVQQANKIFQDIRRLTSQLNDAQEDFKLDLLEDKDYKTYTDDLQEMNSNRREWKKTMIADHPDLRKKHEKVVDIKQAMKEKNKMIKAYVLESIEKENGQLSLFDDMAGVKYDFVVTIDFKRNREDKDDKKKPVIEKIADDIAKENKS